MRAPREIIEALEGTPSRSKRGLLDEAAGMLRAMNDILEMRCECETCVHCKDFEKECEENDAACRNCPVEGCICRDCHGKYYVFSPERAKEFYGK